MLHKIKDIKICVSFCAQHIYINVVCVCARVYVCVCMGREWEGITDRNRHRLIQQYRFILFIQPFIHLFIYLFIHSFTFPFISFIC